MAVGYLNGCAYVNQPGKRENNEVPTQKDWPSFIPACRKTVDIAVTGATVAGPRVRRTR